MVVSQISGPVSYYVAADDGRTFRRHVDHLRIRYSGNAESPSSDEDDDWTWMCRPTHTPVNTPGSANKKHILDATRTLDSTRSFDSTRTSLNSCSNCSRPIFPISLT